MRIKLNDTQLVLISAASQRDDHCLTLPPGPKAGPTKKAAARLLYAGLVRELKARKGAPIWRRDDETGDVFALKLTAAGLKAIAIEAPDNEGPYEHGPRPEARKDTEEPSPSATRTDVEPDALVETPTAPRPSSPRSGTKIALVIEMLRRDAGATVDELVEATGWLPHTTRAALTGLRKRGLNTLAERGDRTRRSVYRLVGSSPIAERSASNEAGSSSAEAASATAIAGRPPLPKNGSSTGQSRRAA